MNADPPEVLGDSSELDHRHQEVSVDRACESTLRKASNKSPNRLIRRDITTGKLRQETRFAQTVPNSDRFFVGFFSGERLGLDGGYTTPWVPSNPMIIVDLRIFATFPWRQSVVRICIISTCITFEQACRNLPRVVALDSKKLLKF